MCFRRNYLSVFFFYTFPHHLHSHLHLPWFYISSCHHAVFSSCAERTLQVAKCSTFPSHLFPTFPHFFPPCTQSALPRHFHLAFSPFSLHCREKEGCLERWLEKEESFRPGSKVHLCFSPPAARANGLVQCADFCRKLRETVCVNVCVNG